MGIRPPQSTRACWRSPRLADLGSLSGGEDLEGECIFEMLSAAAEVAASAGVVEEVEAMAVSETKEAPTCHHVTG